MNPNSSKNVKRERPRGPLQIPPEQWLSNLCRYLETHEDARYACLRLADLDVNVAEVLRILYLHFTQAAHVYRQQQWTAFTRRAKPLIRRARRFAFEAADLNLHPIFPGYTLERRISETKRHRQVTDHASDHSVGRQEFLKMSKVVSSYARFLEYYMATFHAYCVPKKIRMWEVVLVDVYLQRHTSSFRYDDLAYMLEICCAGFGETRQFTPEAVERECRRFKNTFPYEVAYMEEDVTSYLSQGKNRTTLLQWVAATPRKRMDDTAQ